jgi:hypothetical protein
MSGHKKNSKFRKHLIERKKKVEEFYASLGIPI